ncbi:hypothetical protein C8J55DRAFT_227140 [Lentinula edodes]|uniref:Uncharacterized protein n=1 Tax=Lentinula lateritia TaxID=40482 RepID=A0A9W8ZVA4_9AGAR|nr:hypothetical protein C8J55DRAFT_227140 [Lentinula edodes]
MLTSIVLFFVTLPFTLAAPSKYVSDVVNATQTVNFTSITSGYCGTSSCTSFLRPPLTDCNITTCACTDTVSQNLATCLQCGYDNVAGMTLSSAQQYLNNFTTACAANGTSVETETLVMNNAEAHLVVNLKISIALWAVVFWRILSLV